MKNIFFIILIALFASCNQVFIGSDDFANVIKGSGKIVTKTIEVAKINAIELKGSMDIFIVQGNSQEIKIETDDNIIPYADSKVEGSKIVFSIKNNMPFSGISPTKFNIYLTLEQLKSIENDGSGDFTITNLNIPENLNIQNNGSGDIKGNGISGGKIEINNNGSGDIAFQGVINYLTIVNNGSGDINTLILSSGNVVLDNGGSGNIKVFAEKEISINNNGSGDVDYKGNASIKSINSNGSGDVKKIN